MTTGIGRDRRGTVARGVLAASIGDAVEWYDCTVYSTFAVFFAARFFPDGDGSAALLSTLGIFAVGFLMRPLGVLSDRRGRRAALTLSIVLMSLGSLLIAALPPYETIGVAAPLLTLARLAQGLSSGGEFGSASAFLAETAPPARRGLLSSFFYLSIAAGLLLASATATLLTRLLSEAEMAAWGWRVPFLVGAAGALAGLWLRRTVAETAVFEDTRARGERVRRPLARLLRRHPAAALRVIGYTLLATLAFYTFVGYLPTYAVHATGIGKHAAFLANTIGLVVFLLVQPLFGWLADRYGRRPQLLAFSAGYAVLIVPLMSALNGSFAVLLAVQVAVFFWYVAAAAVVSAVAFWRMWEIRGAALAGESAVGVSASAAL